MMNLSSDTSDAARQIAQEFEDWSSKNLEGQLKMHCKIWLAARMKFKDVKVSEMAAAWSSVWQQGCQQALKNAAEWSAAAQKVEEIQNADQMTKVVQKLQSEMQPAFDSIIGF